MDDYLLLGLLFFLFIGILFGIGFLLYFIPKRFGYPRTGKYLSIIFLLLTLTVLFFTVFEDELFTKNEARDLIGEQGIVLNDNFSLEHNESMSAIGEYYHTFTLKISEEDKEKTINKIKETRNFKEIGEPVTKLYFETNDSYNGDKKTQNYETEISFIREYFKPNGDGYAPTYRKITIYKDKNELLFEDIDY